MSPPNIIEVSSAPTQTVPPGESGTSADFLRAARVLHGRGWSERATICALETYRAENVDSLIRRVTRMNPAQDRRFREGFTREARRHKPGRRGDIIQLRSAPRWPWRIGT